jgi:F-type H+-transporting ATPase subunit delta
MTSRGVAARYARALLDVAIAESLADRAGRDLEAFAAVVNQHPPLRQALTHPTVPAARKRALAEQIATRLEVSTPVRKLLALLAERDRMALLPELLANYQERLLDHQRVVRAEVTTAEQIGSDEQARLQERLARATGRQVALTTRVDPAIIGGMVARIGSVVYDGSLATQLAKMRDRLEQQI